MINVRSGALPLALLLLLVPGAALPCSICRCGDPLFQSLGIETYGTDRWRFSADWERFSKASGTDVAFPSPLRPLQIDTEGMEQEVENRFSLSAVFTHADRLTLIGRLPFSWRTIESAEALDKSNGISDPELTAALRVASIGKGPGMGSRAWFSLLGGYKTSWGENNAGEEGTRFDEHLQPGTGAADWTAGASATTLLSETTSGYAGVRFRWPGRNDFGYEYGRSFVVNALAEHRFSRLMNGAMEISWRDAQPDEDGGGIAPDTGGQVLYVAPRVSLAFAGGFVGRAQVQIPIHESLDGFQNEDAVVNIGLTMTPN